MKKLLLITLLWQLFANVHAQSTSDVNEPCSASKPCASGLYCVEVDMDSDYDRVCSECDQSKLAGYTAKVKEYCKGGILKGIPDNEVFREYIASDGRVAVTAFDELMEMVKDCQEARQNRDDACWDGGDAGHREQINQLKNQNSNLGSEKREWIDDQKVYYTTKSTYESRLSSFKYKCDLDDIEDVDEDLENLEDEYTGGKVIDCYAVEKLADICQKCIDAAEDFRDDCFNRDEDNMPEEYLKSFKLAQEVFKRAEELEDSAKDDSKCK